MSADDLPDFDAAVQAIIDCDPKVLAKLAEEDPERFAAVAKVLERALLVTSTRTRPRLAMTAAERIAATKVPRTGGRS